MESSPLAANPGVTMDKPIDCVLCGSCVVDILVKPVPLDVPIGQGRLLHADPIEITTGGIVSNAGIALARLGAKTAAFSFVGRDEWAEVIRENLAREGVDVTHLMEHPTRATSTTAVLVDAGGERSFAHCVGAPKEMTKSTFLEHLDLFARSRSALIGYYSLMPGLDPDLPEVFAAIRETGCLTALDTAGDGGGMEPLDQILPHLDLYVPSLAEAKHQTGKTDPRDIIEVYRRGGAPGLLGVKLGGDGALLSEADGVFTRIPAVHPPGPVVDTTGAGDAFYAGLLAGLLRGWAPERAARLAAAAGACCVTGLGASAGMKNFQDTAAIADID